MKNLLKLTLAVTLVLSATSLFAQKFGRVNVQDVIVEMAEFKTVQANMEAFQKDMASTFEIMQVDYNTKVADLKKNEATYNEPMKNLKYKELQELTARIQEFQDNAQRDIQAKQNELMEPIYKKVDTAINKIAKASAYVAVFNTTPSTTPLAYFDANSLPDLAPAVKIELGIKATTPAK
ncbi:MAG: OmpH family outer membrane protein [Alistipes sp.]